MIVVPVLMTSCHVSEKPKNGPLTAQTITMAQQAMKVGGRPAKCETVLAILVNSFSIIHILNRSKRDELTKAAFIAPTINNRQPLPVPCRRGHRWCNCMHAKGAAP